MVRLLALLLFAACFSLSTDSYAQSIYRFNNFSIDQGLSQSTALFVLQDSQNSIWVGTQDGLNRFDGKVFEVISTNNTPGLASNYIHAGIQDNKGNLWFGTGNGLTFFNAEMDRFETFRPFDESFSVEDLALDQHGDIWLVTSNLGVWKYEVKKNRFLNKTNVFTTRLGRKIFISQNGHVILSSEEPRLQVYKESSGQFVKIDFTPKYPNLPVRVNYLTQVADNIIYLGTNQGIYLLNLRNFRATPAFGNIDETMGRIDVTGIEFGLKEEIYVSTSNDGLLTIQPNGHVVQVVKDEFQRNSLINNEINHLFKDHFDNIWLATARGVSSFHPTYQGILGISKSWDLEHGLPSDNVWSIAENKKGNFLYIGTNNGISKFDRQRRSFVHFNKEIDGKPFDNLVLDIEWRSDSLLLVGSDDGFFQLNIKGNEGKYTRIDFIPEDIQLVHNRVYRFQKYGLDQYFLATSGGVLFIDFRKKSYQSFVHNPKNKTNTIQPGACRLVYKDLDGRILFATSSGGLSQLVLTDRGFEIQPMKVNKQLLNLSKSYITSIVQEDKHTYYLGTGGDGVIVWNSKSNSFQLLDGKRGLPNNVVYAMLKDDFNNIWISTNQGLSQYNLATKRFSNYKEVHGLLSREFNLGAALKSVQGQVFFGGINGLNYFNPSTLMNFDTKLDVILNKLLVNQRVVLPDDDSGILNRAFSKVSELDLKYDQRSFTIRFQVANLTFPELINYKYQLVGSGEKEFEIGTSNEIRFNSLQPGEYTLKIYARYGQGEWISKPRVLYITIHAPYWMTWWFWTIVVFILVGIVRLIIRNRVKQIKIAQVRLEMKIAERTYEIRQQNIQIEQQKKELENKSRLLAIEKEKSERLLRNVIPDSMADELLEKGKASARAFKVVSVMFTDFVGFTHVADQMDPSKLVQYLDVFFKKFDEIIIENNLEKIKTIGDAYMCAGGVPVRNNTNPIDACLAGLQIQHFMEQFNSEAKEKGEVEWLLRLGINTGEVTAGVIGTNRLAYDVWGSTVNRAQRMEMMGKPGKVTITSSTYQFIEPYFECTYMGEVPSKAKGFIPMYQVERIKPELSINGEGIYPNERFRKVFYLYNYSKINYNKAERYILKLLEEKLDDKLHYHGIDHTRDVVQAVERLALSENVTDEGLFLLKTAASYHDAGFVEQYDKNEPIGVRLASEILPRYGYTPEHIETVKELIFATTVPHQPKNQLEEIICDADLDYLGRDDFHEISDRLRLELREHGKIKSDREWDHIQVKFFKLHKYFTKTAKETRDWKKAENLKEILARIEKDDYKD